MKKKINSLVSSQQTVSPIETITDLHLPDECWESIFKFLFHDNQCYLEPLSVVSKQFLSIIKRLRFPLTISDTTLPLLPHPFDRFPNFTSHRMLTILCAEQVWSVNKVLMSEACFGFPHNRSMLPIQTAYRKISITETI